MPQNRSQGSSGTLGDVLYADRSKPRESEQDWVGLVRSTAAGDELALHALYQRAHRPAFTLIMRITADRETAEALTLDVFQDVWRRASDYDPANGTVLAWIMRRARSRAMEQLRAEQRTMRVEPAADRAFTAAADVLSPSASLAERLARRIATKTGRPPVLPAAPQWSEPEWEDVAPGISCKLLATDTEKHRVSMMVRLAPNASYPAHTHAGVEELHLLNGELWIDDKKLFPGDYNLGVPGGGDDRVWSETGCACVLLTSTKDVLR
jgi:anti-sigma factor ChrR (cupin superfamily)